MKHSNLRRRIASLIVLLLALGADPARGAGAETTLVHVGYGGIAGYQLPLWVNKEIGISRKYGIELEPLMISGGALNMQALLAGSIRMSQNSAASAIQAALRGAPVVLIAILENRMPLQIIARPEIKTPQQLIGKKIGILRFGGSNDTAVQWALRVEDRSETGHAASVRRHQRAHDRAHSRSDRRDDPVLPGDLYRAQARHECARRPGRLQRLSEHILVGHARLYRKPARAGEKSAALADRSDPLHSNQSGRQPEGAQEISSGRRYGVHRRDLRFFLPADGCAAPAQS